MEARSRRSLSAEESRFVQRPSPEDVILGCAEEGPHVNESHAGNGYFRGLLLQRSHDFQTSLSEDERLAIAWLVMAKVADRGGRFLTLIDESEEGRPLYVALEKSAVLEQIRLQFEEFSTTHMTRKKPRHESAADRSSSQPQPSSSHQPPKMEKEKPVAPPPKKEVDLVQDDDSSTNSNKSPSRGEPSDRAAASTPEPSVSSNQGHPPVVTTPDQDDTKIQEVVVSSDRTVDSVGERGNSSDEKREQGSTTRMIVKQLRALHQEVAGLKKDRSKLFNEVLNLRDECGHLNRAMLDHKKERAMLHRDMSDLRKMNQNLAEILRSRSPAGPRPESFRPKPQESFRPSPPESFRSTQKMRTEYQPKASSEVDLQKDLADLKQRLQEQQRLTETLLGDPSRDARDSYGQGNLDPSYFMGNLGPQSKKRSFSSEMDLDRSYMSHLSELERARQALKRQKESSPWI